MILIKKVIILASSSPRRREIIEKMGLNIRVVPSTFEENLNPITFEEPSDYVKETAKRKVTDVLEKTLASKTPVDMVIGADTCVTLNGQVFGKPKDKAHAVQMLTSFSGKTHEVITGVYIRSRVDVGWNSLEFHETTKVTFGTLSQDIINAYVDTGEPMDKAGAYGIQGMGGSLIEGITGDYYNVMGFPLHRFTSKLLSL